MSNPTFSLWKCCMTGETANPKLRKKGQQQEPQLEDKHNEKATSKQNEQELEYRSGVDEAVTSTPIDKAVYDENDTDFDQTDEADRSMLSPETENSANIAPSTVQFVKEGDTGASLQHAEIGSGGRMHLGCLLNQKANKINIKINKIEFGAYQDWKMQDLEVSCMLLPMHHQSFRRRAKRFNDPLSISLPPKAKQPGSSLRFRIYDHKTITRKYLIGQGLVSIEDLKLVDGTEVNVLLDLNTPDTYGIDTRYILGVNSAGEAAPESGRPEMLISLEYRALTRKLIVEVIKTRGLGIISAGKPQDVGVELRLVGKDKHVLRICRTNVKKHVIDTEFNEMFMFRLNVERLKEVTLQMVVVRYSDVRNKKENIGDCAFGAGSSSIEQQQHWDSLLRGDAKVEYRWHPLYK